MNLWVIEIKRRHESQFHVVQPYHIFKTEERAGKCCARLNARSAGTVYRVTEYVHWEMKPMSIQVMPEQATLRDQFAMAAAMGMIAARSSWKIDELAYETVAEAAYLQADEMMERRKK